MSQDVEGSVPWLLGEMNGKLDSLIESHKEMADSLKGHDKRLGKLEGYKSWLMGAACAVGVVSSCIKDFFTK